MRKQRRPTCPQWLGRKLGSQSSSWERAILQPVTQVNLRKVSLMSTDGYNWKSRVQSRRAFRTGAKAETAVGLIGHVKAAWALGI
jgi:hypothetical protein